MMVITTSHALLTGAVPSPTVEETPSSSIKVVYASAAL